MSVVVTMPAWAVPSEVWMGRMIDELSDQLESVVCWDTKGETSWRDGTRAVSLAPRSTRVQRYLRRFGLSSDTHSAEKTLANEVNRKGVTAILCHFCDWAVQFRSVWDATDVPLFVHCHGYDVTFDLRRADNPDQRCFGEDYQSEVVALGARATFIANSSFSRGLLIGAGVPADRICVKYLGVPEVEVARDSRATDNLHILQVGRLVDFKSPDRTIRAFEIARSRGLNARLTLAGDGPLRVACELLRAQSLYRESISVLGAVSGERVSSLLAEADIYTQHNIKGEVSRQEEAFGVSVLEAMAAGLPVVGTRSGGVLETMRDGETGILVDPGDVEAQAEALLKLAADPAVRRQMGAAGQTRVAAEFTMEQESRQLRRILGL